MGQRNPDRIPIAHRRSRCETVGQMLQQRWEVTCRCRACRLEMRCDLRTIAIVRGAGFSLWNRNSRCRRVGCLGVVEFYAKAPGMSHADRLATSDATDEPPAWLRNRT